MFLFNSPQLHVGHNIMTVTIWLSIYNKIEIFMEFVSNFIYQIQIDHDKCTMSFSFALHNISKAIRIRIEICECIPHISILLLANVQLN